MWDLVAADLPTPEPNTQLPVLIFGLLGTVVVTLGGIVLALINRSSNRSSPSPPAPVVAPDPIAGKHSERIAVLEHRAEDSDERDQIQDRRLARIEEHLDIRDTTWLL